MSDEFSDGIQPNRVRMTLERLRLLLDAYGAHPDRWPVEEQRAAKALLAASPAAERLCRDAARLDAALDALPVAEPTPELMARVLERAPGARRAQPARRWWRSAPAAMVPLAAAAALFMWVMPGGDAPRNAPAQIAISELGVYTMPTDVLLEPSWADVSGSQPSLGCADDDLGCPSFESPIERQSLQTQAHREYA